LLTCAGREPRKLLEQSFLANLSTSSTSEALQEIAGSLANGYVIPVLGNIQANPGLDEYVKSVGGEFKNYTKRLEGRSKTFGSRAKDESAFLLQQFELQNHNHPGVRQTEAQVGEFSQKGFMNRGVFLGAISLKAKDYRDEQLMVGFDPEKDNPCHGQVWGNPGNKKRRKLLRKASWYVEIAGVSLSDGVQH
jgi:hypothetical protein